MSMFRSLSRAEEQQKETDVLGLSTQYEEDKQQYYTDFTLPCPYLSGRRHPHVAKPVRVLSPVMEEKMKPNKEATEGKINLVSLMTFEAIVAFCLFFLV